MKAYLTAGIAGLLIIILLIAASAPHANGRGKTKGAIVVSSIFGVTVTPIISFPPGSFPYSVEYDDYSKTPKYPSVSITYTAICSRSLDDIASYYHSVYHPSRKRLYLSPAGSFWSMYCYDLGYTVVVDTITPGTASKWGIPKAYIGSSLIVYERFVKRSDVERYVALNGLLTFPVPVSEAR